MVDPSEVIVTTGGQQVIDLVCKTLIDPGDVIVAEAPTYPGAVPTFSAYQADVEQIEMDADGMPIDALEATLDRLREQGRTAEVHLHDPQLPEPGRGDDVAGAAPAPGGGGARARAAGARGQPVRAAALRGRAAAHAVLARRRGGRTRRRFRSGHLPGHVLEDPLAGAAPGMGGRAAAGAREAEPRQTGRGPVLLAGHADVRGGLLRRADGRGHPGVDRVRGAPEGPLPAPARRDAGGAGGALRRARALDAARGRAVHLGDAGRRRRHHRPAGAQRRRGVRARTRRVHGRAPRQLLDAPELRRGARRGHPRGHPADRQDHGRRHGSAGHAHRRDLHAGARARPIRGRRSRRRRGGPGRAHRRRPRRRTRRRARARRTLRWRTSSPCLAASSRPRHADERIDERREEGRGAQGRRFAGADGFAALGRTGAAGAEPAGPRGGGDRRRSGARGAAARVRHPTRRSLRCTAATARTGPCRACWRRSASPTPARDRRRACAARTRRSPST